MQRGKKAISLIFLACSFLCWLLLREIISTVWAIASLPIPEGWVLPPADAISAVGAIVLFIVLYKSQKVTEFADEVIVELAKVVWPNRKETVLSTGIVSILVGICAMILFTFDMVWGALVRIFYQ